MSPAPFARLNGHNRAGADLWLGAKNPVPASVPQPHAPQLFWEYS